MTRSQWNQHNLRNMIGGALLDYKGGELATTRAFIDSLSTDLAERYNNDRTYDMDAATMARVVREVRSLRATFARDEPRDDPREDPRTFKETNVVNRLLGELATRRLLPRPDDGLAVVDFGGADGWFGDLLAARATAILGTSSSSSFSSSYGLGPHVKVIETRADAFPVSGYGVKVGVGVGVGVGYEDESGTMTETERTHIWDGKNVPESEVPSGSADIVCFRVSLHHMDTPTQNAAIRAAHRMLRPGGVCLVKEHDVRGANDARLCDLQHALFVIGKAIDPGISAESWQRFWTDERAKYRSRDNWKQAFERAGLRSVRLCDRFGGDYRDVHHRDTRNITHLYWEIFTKQGNLTP